jgi:phosphatidylserine decarboxylase
MAKSPVITVGRSLPRQVWGLVRDVVPPMHAAGRPFVAGALTLGVFGWRHGWARRTSLVAAGALALFFRAPKRVPPTSLGAVVAPADGVVAIVDEAVPPVELNLGDDPLPRVSIAASVLDPYVHRAPVAGSVVVVAREEDGPTAVRIETPDGAAIGLVQTAGPVAGSIVCDVAVGDDVAIGQTYGLVRFGSRIDAYLPAGSQIGLGVGQRTVGGETILTVLA